MDLFEVMEKRHSYRGPFENTHIPRENLKKIVEAGLIAPSGKNEQTTNFVVVDDVGLVNEINGIHPANKAMQEAVAYIACIIDENPKEVYEGCSFQVEDCAAAVENMLLAITSMGYATVWIDGWLRVEGRAVKVGNILGVPKDKVIRIVLPLGIPKKKHHQPEKKTFEERAWFNKFLSE